jgi:hypothetical protein
MKFTVRAFALSLVLTGLVAGALSSKTSTGVQVVPSNAPAPTDAPMPTCPFQSGDCGLSKF